MCARAVWVRRGHPGCSAGFGLPIEEYHDVFLVPPKDDPRDIVPRVIDEFKGLGFKVTVVDSAKPMEASQGTGFLISDSGHVLTCRTSRS
jgi:hypothetical protein